MCFLGHMLQLSGSEDLSTQADTVLKLLVKMGVSEVNTTTVRNKLRGHKVLDCAEQVEAVFDELVKEGFIRLKARQPIGSGGAGRPAKPLYELNPALTIPQEPSAAQKKLEQGMRSILSQGLEVYTQADEAKKEGMRKMCVSMQAQLE